MSNEHLRLFNGMDTILELRVGAVPKLGVESRCLNHPVLHRGGSQTGTQVTDK